MARILALVSICFALYGCELIADFDRGKIPVQDAGTQPNPPSQPSKDAGSRQDSGAADEDAGNEDDAGK